LPLDTAATQRRCPPLATPLHRSRRCVELPSTWLLAPPGRASFAWFLVPPDYRRPAPRPLPSSQSPARPRAAPLCTGLPVIGPTRLHLPRSRPGTARPKSASPLPAQPNAVCPVAGPTSAPLALCWPPRCRPDLTPPTLHWPPDLSPSPAPGPSQPHWPPLASTEVNLSKL
jgi:hypothetical protein